jgi:hypothetical protein
MSTNPFPLSEQGRRTKSDIPRLSTDYHRLFAHATFVLSYSERLLVAVATHHNDNDNSRATSRSYFTPDFVFFLAAS